MMISATEIWIVQKSSLSLYFSLSFSLSLSSACKLVYGPEMTVLSVCRLEIQLLIPPCRKNLSILLESFSDYEALKCLNVWVNLGGINPLPCLLSPFFQSWDENVEAEMGDKMGSTPNTRFSTSLPSKKEKELKK